MKISLTFGPLCIWLNGGMLLYGKFLRPTRHIIGHFGNDFMGQMTQPTVSWHWRTFVGRPNQEPIPPGWAHQKFNRLTGTLKLQSNEPLYSNTVIGTLVVDGWAVTLITERRAVAQPSPLVAVSNVTAHPSTSSVPTSYYLMCHYKYICPLKG